MHAKKLTCDAMYILKCATSDAVLAKLSYPENITSEQLMKFTALLKFKQDKSIRIALHLDVLKLYGNDMENVILPVLLVYGHVSHFDLEFLQYICNENNKRTVVFGVPY